MYVFTVPGKIAELHPNLEEETKAQAPTAPQGS
jgi:hypothetical protein